MTDVEASKVGSSVSGIADVFLGAFWAEYALLLLRLLPTLRSEARSSLLLDWKLLL